MTETQRQDAERCAGYLKALADATRLQIVQALRYGPLTVSDIAMLLELDLAIVSHHLRVLYHAGITVTEREGKYIYYSLTPELVGNGRNAKALDFGCCKLDVSS